MDKEKADAIRIANSIISDDEFLALPGYNRDNRIDILARQFLLALEQQNRQPIGTDEAHGIFVEILDWMQKAGFSGMARQLEEALAAEKERDLARRRAAEEQRQRMEQNTMIAIEVARRAGAEAAISVFQRHADLLRRGEAECAAAGASETSLMFANAAAEFEAMFSRIYWRMLIEM